MYNTGTPALGVGAGNAAAILDPSCDLVNAVNSIIHSKTFDNGMICATEQTVIADELIYDEVKDEFKRRGCYFLNKESRFRCAGRGFGPSPALIYPLYFY